MQTGRNDPCPCGSGRKYKHCCFTRDVEHEAERTTHRVRQQMAAAAAHEPEWEADAIPLAIRVEERDARRPVLLIVTAGDLIAHSDLRGSLGGEVEDVAVALETAIAAVARDAGVFPESVRVRHEEVAAALAPRLAPRGVDVHGGGVPNLERAAREMIDSMAGAALWPPVCRPDTWAAWDLPRSLIDELFHAAAHFYRLAAWKHASNLQAPRATLPSGGAWTCCVLGNAGQEFGLVLYSEAADLFEVVAPDDQPFEGVRGRIISLGFDRASEIDPDMRREIKLHGWEVAGPAAIPVLTTINTPGGGVTRADVRDLITLLGAVPAFVHAHARALRAEERTGTPVRAIEWTESATNVSFRYAGEAVSSADLMYEHDDDDYALADDVLPPDIASDIRATMRAVIREVEDELGDDADEDTFMELVNRKMERQLEALNAQPQHDFGGLSPAQVRRLLHADWADSASALELRRHLPLADVARSSIFTNARTLLTYMAEQGSLGATQAGNLKVDAVARLMDVLELDAMYLELRERGKRITEQDVWPLYQLRSVCELAGLLRRRRQRFELTEAGRELLDDARAGELFALLFRTWFRALDSQQFSRWDWPELLQQVAYTLYRLPSIAAEWCAVDDMLDDVILPFARARAPAHPDVGLAAISLAIDVLRPLTQFGLLERREGDDRASAGFGFYRTTPLAGKFLRFNL
jgi:hypothetical protein